MQAYHLVHACSLYPAYYEEVPDLTVQQSRAFRLCRWLGVLPLALKLHLVEQKYHELPRMVHVPGVGDKYTFCKVPLYAYGYDEEEEGNGDGDGDGAGGCWAVLRGLWPGRGRGRGERDERKPFLPVCEYR